MPALIQSLGALPGAGFSTNAITPPSAAVGTTPNALGSSTWVSAIVTSAPRSSWNSTIALEVEAGEHVAVAHDEALVDAVGREADRAGGAERLVLDRVAQPHAAERVVARLVAEVRVERVGEVAHREHDLVDAVIGEPHELALEERLVRDRQQRLRGGERQRPQPRPLAADEDDGLHGAEVMLTAARLAQRAHASPASARRARAARHACSAIAMHRAEREVDRGQRQQHDARRR